MIDSLFIDKFGINSFGMNSFEWKTVNLFQFPEHVQESFLFRYVFWFLEHVLEIFRFPKHRSGMRSRKIQKTELNFRSSATFSEMDADKMSGKFPNGNRNPNSGGNPTYTWDREIVIDEGFLQNKLIANRRVNKL